MMASKEMPAYLVLGTLLITYIFKAGVGSTCVNLQCLKCHGPVKAVLSSNLHNDSLCVNGSDIPDNCTARDFQAYMNASSGYDLQEGDDIRLLCYHNLPLLDLSFEWQKNNQTLKGENESTITLTSVLTSNKGKYKCIIYSPCGRYPSNHQQVNVQGGGWLILGLCGLLAVGLVLSLGLAMKYKLKQENDAHKRRQEQRAQNLHMRDANPPAFNSSASHNSVTSTELV